MSLMTALRPQPAANLSRARPEPTADLLALAELLWGDGFLLPGGAEHLLDLIEPLQLEPGMDLLDLSAGLGGAGRIVMEATGAWVTGLEPSLETARRGAALARQARTFRKASVQHYVPDALELASGAFDAALGRFATYQLGERERFLRAVCSGLKADGRLLLVEYVLGPKANGETEIAAVAGRAEYVPPLWSREQYVDCLMGAGLEPGFAEDLTAVHRSLVIAGWHRLLAELDIGALSRTDRIALVEEARLWAQQVAAIDGGALEIACFYATRPARIPGVDRRRRRFYLPRLLRGRS